jgi:hypothetical protein
VTRWPAGRRTPYTEIGIRRCRCVRCGNPARFQWNACADGRYRPVCADCDILLNAEVLAFMRDPDAAEKMRRYIARVTGS